jgi:hypothetical protein
MTGFGDGRPGFIPIQYKDNTYQLAGNVYYIHGNHSFKTGASLIRRYALSSNDNNGMGNFLFANGAPGLLTGGFSGVTRALTVYQQYYQVWEAGIYVQDDWRVTPKLTLNLGVRWDLFTPFTEKYNHIGNFDFNTGQLIAAGVNGVSRSANVQYNYHNIEPRLGFAFTPRQGSVIRGGFGMAYFPDNESSPSSLRVPPFVFPYGTCTFASCPGGFDRLAKGLPTPATNPNPAAISPTCVNSATLTCTPISILSSEPFNYKDGYLEQFNLVVEQQLPHANVLTVAYVSELGRHLGDNINNVNIAPPNVTPSGLTAAQTFAYQQSIRRFGALDPNVTQIEAFFSDGSSSYHSLQTSLSRAFKNGLTYRITDTWAHGTDNVYQPAGGGTLVITSLANHHFLDYSNSDLDVNQRVVATLSYAPTYGSGWNPIARGVLAGWQANVLNVWSTGIPFTLNNTSNRSGTNPAGGADRPNVDMTQMFQNVPAGGPGQIAFFNPAAFTPQPFGTIGNARRNIAHGPQFHHLDAGVSKAFQVHESIQLKFRAEGFNVFNSHSFGNPNTSLANLSTMGRITSLNTGYIPRVLQFAVRLDF